MPPTPIILVLSSDAMVAALLGALAEHEGLHAAFSSADESAEAAVERVLPSIVIADCDLDGCCGEDFVRTARGVGAAVLLFTHRRDRIELQELAERMGVPWFAMPLAHGEFSALLARLRHATD